MYTSIARLLGKRCWATALHFCFLHPSLFLSPCSASFTLLFALGLTWFFFPLPLFLHPPFFFILTLSFILFCFLYYFLLFTLLWSPSPPLLFLHLWFLHLSFPCPFSISCLFSPYFLFFTLLCLFFASSSFSFTFLFLNLPSSALAIDLHLAFSFSCFSSSCFLLLLSFFPLLSSLFSQLFTSVFFTLVFFFHPALLSSLYFCSWPYFVFLPPSSFSSPALLFLHLVRPPSHPHQTILALESQSWASV